MLSANDLFLLSEFIKALNKNDNASYSDLDDHFTQKFDFFINRYEEIKKVTGNHIPPHKWSYHRIGLLTQGEAHYTCGIYRFTAKKNTLLIIPARMITTSDWSSGDKGYTILFNSDFLLQNNLSYKAIENKSILQLSVQPYLSLDEAQSQQLIAIFETILKEKDDKDQLKNELIALKIVELLITCERFYTQTLEQSPNQQNIEILKKFTNLIEYNFAQERTVGFYAKQLNIHPNYLNAVIKSNTGITAKESIQNRILI